MRVKRNYEGVSDPVVRESFTIIETLVANIAGGRISFHFVKTNEEQTSDTSIINGLLDYFLSSNHVGLKTQEWVREMLMYGTGILHIGWAKGKPIIENIPLRDFFVDPNATSLETARYAGYQYLLNKTVAKRAQIYDKDTDSWVPRYKNLELLDGTSTKKIDDAKPMDKVFKDMFNTSTFGEDDGMKNQYHVIRIYDLDTGRVMEVGNGKEFIYDEVTWCQREEKTKTSQVEVDGKMVDSPRKLDEIEPFLPFAVLRDYVDTSLFYGEGEMAVLLDPQEELNDLEAMDLDNNAYQNTPMYQIDPQFADLAPEIETIPGAVYPIPKGALTPLERPQLGADMDAKKDRIAAQMRRSTAADENVQGVNQDQGRITATEVSSALTQAQTRFATKIQNLEAEGYAQLGSVLFKFQQIFVDEPMAARIVGKNGTEFKTYDPYDFNGEWEPGVQLDSTIKQKQMEVGQKDNQIYQQLQEDPQGIFNPVAVKRWIIQHIDPNVTDEQFNDLLMVKPGETPPPPPPAVPKPPQDSIIFSYKDATPFTQFQIEKLFGLTPDPSHMQDEIHGAVKQGAEQADMLNPRTLATGAPDSSVPPLPEPAPMPAGMVS